MAAFLLITAMFQPGETINLSEFDIYDERVEFIVNPNGIIAILLDAGEKAMLLIGPNGELIAKCGRSGQGPREFRSPDSVWWESAAKTFSVYDSENNRISHWDARGTFVSAEPGTTRIKSPLEHDAQTLFYVRNGRGTLEEAPALMKKTGGKPTVFWEVGEDRYPLPNIKIQGYTMAVSTAWDPVLIYGLGSNFIALVYTANDQVLIYNLDGTLRKRLAPALEQYEVSDEDIDRHIGNAFQIARSALNAKRKELFANKTWPEIRNLLVDGKDRIWVVGRPDRRSGRFPIHIYDAAGKLIRKATMANEPAAISGVTVYSLMEDGEEILLRKDTL